MTDKVIPQPNQETWNWRYYNWPTLYGKKRLEEIVDYKWKELKHGFETKNLPEEPIKKNDHAMDCLRYLVHYVEDSDSPVEKSDDYGLWGLLKPKRNSWMSA